MTISCPCMEINKSNRYLPWQLFLCKNLSMQRTIYSTITPFPYYGTAKSRDKIHTIDFIPTFLT